MRGLASLLLAMACSSSPEEEPGPSRSPDPPDPIPSDTGMPTVPDPTEVPPRRVELGDMELPTLTATPPGSAFSGSVEVTLEASDTVSTIWYTDDGSVPQIGLSIPYTGPLTFTQSTQIRAVAEVLGKPVGVAPTYVALDSNLVGFSSDLPLVVLWSADEAPTVKSEIYSRFTLSTFEPAVGGRAELPGEATLSERSGLRVRGSSSAYYEKKPYRIEVWDPLAVADVDLDVPLLGMPTEADWVLLAPLAFDRALMRNALMYALSNHLGRYAPRTRFAEVFVAERGEPVGFDDYQGVYVVVERIERDTDRVDVARLGPTDIALPELSGGYIFKEDRLGPGDRGFYAGDAGGLFSFQQPFVFVDPSEEELRLEQAAYVAEQLDELGGALASRDFTHPLTGRHYDQIIDVDSWIDHHILNVFAKNPDAFRLSGYFHKDREGPIQAGPLWDFDRTMGCADDTRASDPTWWDPSNETSDCTYVFEHGFWPGLFADPAFVAQYWQRWADLLGAELSLAAVEAEIDAMEAELAEAAPRNFEAWPTHPPRGGSFEAEVELLRAWVRDRHGWASACLARPDPSQCMGR